MKISKTFIKPFEVPQRSVKIKTQVNVLSSSGIKTGKGKFFEIKAKRLEHRAHNLELMRAVDSSSTRARSYQFSSSTLKSQVTFTKSL